MLSGYKTYIVAGIMFARAVMGYLMGDDHSWSAVDWAMILNASGLAALRAGIKNG